MPCQRKPLSPHPDAQAGARSNAVVAHASESLRDLCHSGVLPLGSSAGYRVAVLLSYILQEKRACA